MKKKNLSKKLINTSYLARYFFLNKVDLSDYRIFPSRAIENTETHYSFSKFENRHLFSSNLDRIIPQRQIDHYGSLDQFLEKKGTTAFLVIHDDKLVYERYFNGFNRSSICTSFSVSKSFASALIGIALNENLIQSLDDSISKYLPELSAPFWADISIRHLLSMSSGLKYDQNGFLPWNDEPRVYYSLNLRQLAMRAKKQETPGNQFHYNNYNLILLGMVIERVSDVSVSEFLQEKLWKPLGMTYPASWSLDSELSGMEKMESGLNARAIDYAKFGRLYLQKGNWDGKQIIPESWIIESTTIDSNAKWDNYKYLWWVSRKNKGRYLAVGNLGQFIYVVPDKNCLILRFGRGKPRDWKTFYPQLFSKIADIL